jgi:hypothetical protein
VRAPRLRSGRASIFFFPCPSRFWFFSWREERRRRGAMDRAFYTEAPWVPGHVARAGETLRFRGAHVERAHMSLRRPGVGSVGFRARWFGPRIPIPSTRRGSLRAHSSRTPGFLTCGSGSWWDPDVGGTEGCFRGELWVAGGDRIRPWELGFCFARGEEFGIFCGKSCYVASVTRGSL